jgi:Ser/Thr protein kinase RdoA (MazF antagonist)
MSTEQTRNWRPGRGWRGCQAVYGLLALLAAAACTDGDPTAQPTGLSRGEFIEIMVALREAEWEASEGQTPRDSVQMEFEGRKAEILARYGAAEGDLHAFLERNYQRPGFMGEVWDSIAKRLRVESRAPAPSDARTPFEEL